MKGFLIMDRRRNSLEQDSKRVGEGQPRRSSQHHFIYRSPETSLTSKEQMDNKNSDKETGKLRLWCEKIWTEKVAPKCRQVWTQSRSKVRWIQEANKTFKEIYHEEWNLSSVPYNKWRDDMIKSLEAHKIYYNDEILVSEWYDWSQDWKNMHYNEFMFFSQNKLNDFMEDRFMNSTHDIFVDTMVRNFPTKEHPFKKKDLNQLIDIGEEDLRKYIEKSFDFNEFVKDCIHEFAGNKREKTQEEDQEDIFYLEL